MAGSDNISPPGSVFGTKQVEGVVVVQASRVNMPGGIIFTTVDAIGTKNHLFMWLSTVGDLRIIVADGTGPVVYDDASNTITFDNFDQDADGNALAVV